MSVLRIALLAVSLVASYSGVAWCRSPSSAEGASAAPSAVAQKAKAEELTNRLRHTKAIGVFTKLSIKKHVDKFVDDFHAYQQGRAPTGLGQLRQSFNHLVHWIASLVRPRDPRLSSDIQGARELLWGALTGRARH